MRMPSLVVDCPFEEVQGSGNPLLAATILIAAVIAIAGMVHIIF